MAKQNKKRGADASSPFVLIRSKTGRSFQRCGIRFSPERDEPVNLDKLSDEHREQLLASTAHLKIEHVSESEFEAALHDSQLVEDEELGDFDIEQTIKENAELKEEVASLRAEIALLTGRRSSEGGPRENDDKSKSAPLVG